MPRISENRTPQTGSQPSGPGASGPPSHYEHVQRCCVTRGAAPRRGGAGAARGRGAADDMCSRSHRDRDLMAAPRTVGSLSEKELLHLCATGNADSDLPAQLTAALEAALSRRARTAQALSLLSGLCELAQRKFAEADGGGLAFQKKVVELLHTALEKTPPPCSVCGAARRPQPAATLPHTGLSKLSVQAVSTMKCLALPSDSPLVAGVRCARSQGRCRVQTPIAVTGGSFKYKNI